MAFNELGIYFVQLKEVYETFGLPTSTNNIESSPFLDRALTTIDRPLFRWRRRPDLAFPQKNFMLNIPVYDRHKIKDVRYGFETRSSLYLGSSSYVCWKEMDELEVDKVSACAFKFDASDLFLDFRLPMRNIGEIVKKGKMAMLERILMTPFLISVHIKTLFKNAHFKEEYIMTKLFSSYLMLLNDKVKGIIYSSTKIDYHIHSLEDHYSVFIPSNPIGELELNFKMTSTCDLKEILNAGIDALTKSLPQINTSGKLNI